MSTTRAARALVAYFDHKLAARLAAHVLKNTSVERTKAFADAVLALVPKACTEVLYQRVKACVDAAGAAYCDGPAFRKAVDSWVAGSSEKWATEEVEQVVKERVRRHVEHAVKNDYESYQAVKNAPGKFQATFDAELGRLAREAAAAVGKGAA